MKPMSSLCKSRFANKRGTYDLNGSGFKGDVAGSDKSVAFPLPCDPALDWVAVFEAPIDLMSFCTLHPKVTSNAVALCGLYQGPLDTYLKDHPHLKNIILCLDADGPGREAAEKLTAEYEQRGYQVSVRTPELGKDWNEYLQHLVFGKEIAPPKTTKSNPEKEAFQPMADLGKLINDKTAADTQWREQRQAEREAAASLRDESVTEITRNPEAYARYLDMQIDLSMLPEGSYEVIEIECAGYVVDDAQRIIHLRANDTAQFVFTNTKKPGFRLIKTSADGTPLDGVTFRIARIEDGSRYLDRTTQDGGEISVDGWNRACGL